jgi:hydroxymethylglutaryl-CoA lyase
VNLPTVIYNEEVMREGFGIEDVRIPLEAKVEFLDALSDTGLKRITVGAFVSPRFVPQMANFEELLRRFHPKKGVTYVPFIHNQKARELSAQYSPPLTVEEEWCSLFVDVCDVHQRRNVNRSIEQIMAYWPAMIQDARSRGISKGRVGVFSAYGSNFLGKFSQSYRFSFLEREIELLTKAGIEVVEIGLHDSQSWCVPNEIEDDIRGIKHRWPKIKQFHLHIHDARGMALPALYVALRTLDKSDTVLVDGTLGGIGGGQYCGNGRASGMAATEDFLHMLDGMGVETGVNLDKVIDCVWMLEKIIGRPAFGHVSKAGPRPTNPKDFYDPNMPAVESFEAAKHFKLGQHVYQKEGYSPWKEPIIGPFLQERVNA